MDVAGEHQTDVDHDIFKVSLDLQGNPKNEGSKG